MMVQPWYAHCGHHWNSIEDLLWSLRGHSRNVPSDLSGHSGMSHQIWADILECPLRSERTFWNVLSDLSGHSGMSHQIWTDISGMSPQIWADILECPIRSDGAFWDFCSESAATVDLYTKSHWLLKIPECPIRSDETFQNVRSDLMRHSWNVSSNLRGHSRMSAQIWWDIPECSFRSDGTFLKCPIRFDGTFWNVPSKVINNISMVIVTINVYVLKRKSCCATFAARLLRKCAANTHSSCKQVAKSQ